jgi:hypothetical protein
MAKKLNEFQKVEKEARKEFVEVEKWVIQRRKFLMRLGVFLALLILVLLYAQFFIK